MPIGADKGCPRSVFRLSVRICIGDGSDRAYPVGLVLSEVSDDAYPAGLLLFEGRLSHPGDMRLPQVGLEIP